MNSANHRWGDKLFTELYFEIEKIDWLTPQKKRQLIMIISNSWWIYLNSLKSSKENEFDLIRYVDAYNRFFSFLSKLDEFDLFTNFWTNLLKSIIRSKDFSVNGVTKLINSFCEKVKKREDKISLVELQLLLMYLRKSVIPSDLFRISLKILGEILYKIEPAKKSLFLYIIIENVRLDFLEESEDFVNDINKILTNRLPSYLKDEFSNLRKISINERNFTEILADLEALIYYLNHIGEHSWIIILIKNIFSRIREYRSLEEAVQFIKKYIDFSVNRNQFQIAYAIYDFLEDVFMYQTDLGYDTNLIELWVDACKKFVDMKEKKYLYQSLEKLSNHLKTPQTNEEIFHYFYTYNYLWQFKSKFFVLDSGDFWKMIFFRTLFEEKQFDLAQKIISFLPEEIQSNLTDLNSLFRVAESIKPQIYSLGGTQEEPMSFNADFLLNKMILRINAEGAISFKISFKNEKIMEGRITDEYWNDLQIMEIYNDLFSGSQQKTYPFNLIEFGKLLYNFLPKTIRTFFEPFKSKKLNYIPQIYIILDNMTIPFDLFYDNNFFMLKYSCGYKIGEPPLGGIISEQVVTEDHPLKLQNKYNILLVEVTNLKGPLKWNEESKQKILVFPFVDAAEEFDYITHFFNNQSEINEMTILSGLESSREKILTSISQEAFHIIHFVGNIFYSNLSPKDSYFLTNENNLITFHEIKRALDKNQHNIQPILFFNVQIFDMNGIRLRNVLRTFGEIIRQFNFDRITGIISRIYPLFNESTREIMSNFYINLFENNTLAEALLNARKQCKSGLAISSFILFGKPWKLL
ncbi:MAG: hypothetical protein EU532_11160 [Promethearchaeota archaeon]|nr:MAG: hypothetical protein EU532_11160 [Candidatus Lokiarchaeota archaeon]